MHGFLSNYTRRIDSKGRVVLPAPFRAALTRDGYEGLYCYPSLDMKAVDAGGNGLLGQIDKRLAKFEAFTEEHDFLSTAFYGLSQHLSVDPEGRVALTDSLLQFAGIAEEIAFVGQGYKFQIWEPGRYAEHQAEARRRALALRRPRAATAVAGEGQA